MGGTDKLHTSMGDHWQPGPIHAPKVLYARMNIAQLGDGRAQDLQERLCGLPQRAGGGCQFNANEYAEIVAFLKTLTGDQPHIVLPVLPPSTETTPHPQPFE